MKLDLVRHTYTKESTIGSLAIDGIFQCYSLERPDDGKNTINYSAIPEGTYPIRLLWSEHFGRKVPHLVGVQGRSDIEIHVGNLPSEVKGCILVGKTKMNNFVGNSHTAFNELMFKLNAATDPITLEISRTAADPLPAKTVQEA